MQSYNCPRCGRALRFDILQPTRWYCDTCQVYPFEETAVYSYHGQTQCPVCGNFLTYVELYKAWFCYHCQKYIGFSDLKHNSVRCPACSNELTYSAQYGKWYCYTCQKYIGIEKVDKSLDQARVSRGTVIEDIFILYNDGRLIKHSTRRLKPTVDSDVLTSMLVAVQEFVRDALKSDERETVDEIKVGEIKIHIIHGRHISVAVLIQGDDVEGITRRVRDTLSSVEEKYEGILSSWDGKLSTLNPVVKQIESLFLS